MVSLVTTALLVEAFALLFAWSPARDGLGSAFFTFLPVIISAIVLSFLKVSLPTSFGYIALFFLNAI
jgi:hypothetical protein